MKVVVIEDCPSLGSLLTEMITRCGHKVSLADTGKKGLRFIEEEKPNVVVTDIGLPDICGTEICNEIRKNKYKYGTPYILVCTGKIDDEMGDTILSSGFDEYVKKPFRMKEIEFKFRKIGEMNNNIIVNSKENELIYGNIKIKKEEFEVYENDILVNLSKREFELICLFIENRGKALSRERIIELIWSDKYFDTTDRAVDSTIMRMRKKFSTLEENLTAIRSVGYKLN